MTIKTAAQLTQDINDKVKPGFGSQHIEVKSLLQNIVDSTADVIGDVTPGTVSASLPVVVDANKDITGFRNVTITGILASSAAHLPLNSGVTATDVAGKTVRINSITSIGTANSFIGFQSKPRQGASMANNVIGAEISAQISDTFALTGSGSIIGAHVDCYVRGTTGNIAGDVRGLQIELVTDDAGARNITGNVSGIRMRAAFSAGTVSGLISAIRVEKMEAQTGSEQWGYLFDLTDDNGLVWSDGYGTEATDENGSIKVRVNGQDRWIKLYGTAPIA